MTADNRTNEQLSGISGQFSEAQVEAAAKAIADNLFPNWSLFSRARASKDRGSLIHVAARAALVAAQGAAPQADEKCEKGHPKVYGEGYSCWVHNADWPCKSVPVLPSSTVDEIAEVIRHAMNNGYREWPEGIARAVVEAIGGES